MEMTWDHIKSPVSTLGNDERIRDLIGSALVYGSITSVFFAVVSAICMNLNPNFGSLLPMLLVMAALGYVQCFGASRFGGSWLYFVVGINALGILSCYLVGVGVRDAALNELMLLFLAGFGGLWLDAAKRGGRSEQADSREQFRLVLVAHNASCIACSTVLFVGMVQAYRASSFITWNAFGMASLACSLLVGSWLYACIVAASDSFFFSRVLSRPGQPKLDAPSLLQFESNDQFIAIALASPSLVFRRIREELEPGIGCFHVRTEYDINIPNFAIDASGRTQLNVPLILFGNDELTNTLKFSANSGIQVRRLGEGESCAMVKRALCSLLKDKGLAGEVAETQSEALVRIAYSFQADDSNRRLDEESAHQLKKLGADKEVVSYISGLFYSLKYVKPTMVVLAGRAAAGDVASLVAERDVSLVPVKEVRAGRTSKVRARFVRLFTKRRMRYYYNLGNADCAQTYHLTFSGLDRTYLTKLGLCNVGEDDEFFIADEMKVTNRYDQRRSRLYVRNGHGFSRCALMACYEERSHKAVTALCATSLVCFLILFAMAFNFVFSAPSEEVQLRDMILPITVLGFGGVLSIWEAMETYRAEEWLWLGSSASVVVSFVAISHFIWLNLPECVSPSLLDELLWLFYMTVEFAIMESAVMALYEKIKQHGALMDKVPFTRKAPRVDDKAKQRFHGLVAGLERNLDCDDEDASTADDGDDRYHDHHEEFPGKEAQYDRDILAYAPLVSRNWGDGWLVPSWASAFNPAKSPYRAFCDYAHDVLESEGTA